jgi:hypothetical protein
MTSLSDKNTTTEDKEDKDWNEAALAELVGLESKAREENTDYHTSFDDNNVITQGDLFDSPTTNPHENQTERSLAKKPLPKLGLVGVGLLAVFGIGGLALSSMMGVKKPNLSNSLAKSSTENKTSIVAKKTDENQEGKLKTQLALASQAEDLKAIDSRAKDKKREGVKPGEKEQKTTPTPTQSPTTIKPIDSTPTTSYHPPPPTSVAYSPPVRFPSPPTPVAYPPPPRSPSPSPPRSPSPPTPVAYPPPTRSPSPPPQESRKPLPSEDSSEQWNRLAMLGSYGRVEEIGVQGERIQGENISQNSPPLSQHPASSGIAQQPISPEISSPPPVVIVSDEDRVLRGITVKRLIPGTVASAFLSTSLVWVDESQSENFSTQKSQFKKSQSDNFTTEKSQSDNFSTEKSQSEKSQIEKYFVVTLAESLVDVDGNEAIHAAQQIVFSITAVSTNGLVTATAVSLIDEQGIERPLPSGAITVQRDSEKPLLAEGLFDPGGEIASMDFGIAGLGAVAQIGEILNRPKQQQQQSISGTQISTTTSSTTGNPNIIGAVMEGAATPVLESIQKRNQEAIERLSEQKNVWFLPIGESVQVIVTQPFDL